MLFAILWCAVTIRAIMEPTTPKRKSRTGLWIFLGLLIFGLMASVTIGGFALIGAMGELASGGVAQRHSLLHRGHPVDQEPQLSEVWSFGRGDEKVVRIELDGVIMHGTDGGFFEAPIDPIESILTQIRAATNDEDVRGIILEVNSPGGGVTPSDEIYAALKRFKKEDEKRKVVVFMRDLCASGGYYVSMAGDWLIAEPTTIVGSIGVIMGSMNFKGLADKVGVKDVTIKSGKNKDLLNPLTDVNPEQVAILQKMIDSTYERFFGIVKDNRQIREASLRELCDGRVFDAPEALKLKLVDQIGYFDDSITKMADLLGEKDIKVVRYQTRSTFFDRILAAQSESTPVKQLEQIQHAARPKLQYLWQP
jgi:protease IV